MVNIILIERDENNPTKHRLKHRDEKKFHGIDITRTSLRFGLRGYIVSYPTITEERVEAKIDGIAWERKVIKCHWSNPSDDLKWISNQSSIIVREVMIDNLPKGIDDPQFWRGNVFQRRSDLTYDERPNPLEVIILSAPINVSIINTEEVGLLPTLFTDASNRYLCNAKDILGTIDAVNDLARGKDDILIYARHESEWINECFKDQFNFDGEDEYEDLLYLSQYSLDYVICGESDGVIDDLTLALIVS